MRHCHVTLSYLEPGNNALMTGLALLANRGELRLSIEVTTPPAPLTEGPWHLRDKAESGIRLTLDGARSAYVDVHDSWEIDALARQRHDLYFKRSFDPQRVPAAKFPTLRPLGLVNDVRRDGFDAWELRRILAQRVSARERLRDGARFVLDSLAAMVDRGPRPNLALLQAPPDTDSEPSVLFMAGVWDPARVPEDEPDKAAEFDAINETRAACVRLLRSAFGERFFGGLMHSEFAARRYPDVLLPEARAASKRAYVQRVRRSAICVATRGLHGSNGWKLAEYVGLSRAIVTEPLQYAVPGDFAAGHNYHEFAAPEACVERVGSLLENPAQRKAQMQANWKYYNRWMRPDSLARHVVDQLERRPA